MQAAFWKSVIFFVLGYACVSV